ncbi:hypothetical protein [Phenylobacterium deserti]|uniref:Uncharacterized protein n=1 Tax=Phenylobacterium deserti TaxID=1914756 RepID=A0A328AQY4_9CAUL|nr:hypothetical protein [Phenylobacterium deserti]RAK57430.1 hypothetical protein DJ018_05680 [Phenylobacterium deserti]
MNTIRPGFPQPQPTPQRADAARVAAQRAFFQMATTQAEAPAPRPQAAAQMASQASSASASRPQRMPDARAEPPNKVLRPGSLLDIRI